MPRRIRYLCLGAAITSISIGLWQVGGAVHIQAKAWLAQALLQRAWAATLDGGTTARPWPWADTWPVARLAVPDTDIDQIVLAGASGRILAFGPGHVAGSAHPGMRGHSILGGHRDTHFAFLADLQPGMELRLQAPDGAWRRYEVLTSEVVDSRHARLMPYEGRSVLSLVTCFPFDAIQPGGPLRYVVSAVGIEQAKEEKL